MSNIEFEHIDPWTDGQGDTGQSSRMKLRRNFEKIKAWMDSIVSQLTGEYLSKKNADEAAGKISFRDGTEYGPASGLWGWVRETYQRTVGGVQESYSGGVAWFHWLLADRLKVSGIAQFLSHLYVDGKAEVGSDLTVKGDGAFYKSLNVMRDAFVQGDLSVDNDINVGCDISIGRNANVGDTLTTKNLTVTGLAHFFELIIDKLRSAGGAQVYTPADGFKAEAVTKFTTAGSYRARLWWRATDGSRKTTNMWKPLDQAICMSFNEAAEGSYQDVSNKQYWALVAAAGTNRSYRPAWDGTNPAWDGTSRNPYEQTDWHYIEIYCGDENAEPVDETGDERGEPRWTGPAYTVAAGDEVAMLGSRSDDDPARQNALYISAYSSFDTGDTAAGIRGLQAPLIAYYEGIDDFNLSRHRTTFKDRLGGNWVGTLLVKADDGTEMSLDDYINSVVDIDVDADFYRLRPTREDAWVTAGNTMAVNLRYQLEHVSEGKAQTEAWTNSGFTVRVLANGTGSALSTVTYGTGAAGNAIFSRSYTASATKPDFFTVALMKDNAVIDQRVVRVAMKAGTTFEVTEAGIAAAVQAAGDLDEQLRTEFEATAEGIRSEVSSLKISKNLLLNADFADEAASGLGAIHLVPTRRWQGYMQDSKNAQGDWVARLTRNTTYTLSFYARGQGTVGCVIHGILVSSGSMVVNTGGVWPINSTLRRYTCTFTPTSSCAFRVMLGSNANSSEVTGTEIYISRPQLEAGDKATIWTATGARNLLSNSSFDNVEKGIPDGWQLWENEESGSVVAPTTREIVAEQVTALWDVWNGSGKTTAPLVQEIRIDGSNGWKYLHLEPSEMFQGIVQQSTVRSDGEWRGVLQHGGWYTMSFYARGMGRCDALLHFIKLSGAHIAAPQPSITADTSEDAGTWKRYSLTFLAVPASQSDWDTEQGYGFALMLGCSHYSEDPDYHVPSETIEIARPQLEEGKTASEWRRGEENPSLVATRFEQAADRMSLALYRDGVKRSGMTIDEDGVELDGKTTKITGDLDIQGLTTENVTPVARMIYIPTVVNMGVLPDDDSDAGHIVKSVQVKGNSDYTHIVALPFYDANYAAWASEIGTPFNADGSFPLFGAEVNGTPVAEWQRLIQPWKKNGTRLTITNEVINKYRNWSSIASQTAADMLGGMVLVCSDARVICATNIARGSNAFNPPATAGQYPSNLQLHAGRFSCNGDAARFIWLLPGQTLQLRSEIVDMQGRDVLIWVVENAADFVKIPRVQMSFQDGLNTMYYTTGTEGAFNPSESLTSTHESVLAPSAFGYQSRRNNYITKEFPGLYYYYA